MPQSPLMLTTWRFGPVGNSVGFPMLQAGGDALHAAVACATAIEDDEAITSVGSGALPDASGQVSLDACIMTAPDRCGAVAYVRNYPNPARIALRVMEETCHIMLVGQGAEDFALTHGFEPRPLLSGASRDEWLRWRHDPARFDREPYKGWIVPGEAGQKAAPAEPYTHDTVSIIARDQSGQLAGVCSTSGMAFKTPGRVGDSPIIGHGLYVDPSAGAAAATGNGELIMGLCGSFLVVELMRQGRTPLESCMELLRRTVRAYTVKVDHQVAVIAMNQEGDWASAALKPGFHHTISDAQGTRVEQPHAVLLPGD